jgi:hypothetical protein
VSTESIAVTVEGMSPLLMHRFPIEPLEVPIEKMTPAAAAEVAAYRLDGAVSHLYVPGQALQRALVAGATYSKGKGRGSMQKPVAACVLVTQEKLDLGTASYEVDARPVTIPATGGRVVRYRPRLDSWSLTFVVDYDPELVSAKQLRQVVDDTGSRVGLLDFRPERKGPYGRFKVVHWQAS